jgi:hypothetical protein
VVKQGLSFLYLEAGRAIFVQRCKEDADLLVIPLLSSLGRAKNYRYQRYFVPYKISIVSFHSGTTMFL